MEMINIQYMHIYIYICFSRIVHSVRPILVSTLTTMVAWKISLHYLLQYSSLQRDEVSGGFGEDTTLDVELYLRTTDNTVRDAIQPSSSGFRGQQMAGLLEPLTSR